MAKSKDKQALSASALRPYVQRAMADPDLREDLIAAFVAARGLYAQLAKKRGMRGKAEKISDKHFQSDLQQLVADLSEASDRLQGKGKKKAKKRHRARNRVVLLTGVTLGVLYNPWTGQATRDWIMSRVSGDGERGSDEFASGFSIETATPEEAAAKVAEAKGTAAKRAEDAVEATAEAGKSDGGT